MGIFNNMKREAQYFEHHGLPCIRCTGKHKEKDVGRLSMHRLATKLIACSVEKKKIPASSVKRKSNE